MPSVLLLLGTKNDDTIVMKMAVHMLLDGRTTRWMPVLRVCRGLYDVGLRVVGLRVVGLLDGERVGRVVDSLDVGLEVALTIAPDALEPESNAPLTVAGQSTEQCSPAQYMPSPRYLHRSLRMLTVAPGGR